MLTAEILAPSSHIQVLFESEIPRKIAVVMAIASDISGIPRTILRCNAACSASSRPCLLLQIGRRGVPGPVQAILRMPAETLVDHLSRFAIAGLEAIGRDYADSAPTRRKKK